jgi:hypothetical protein
MLYQTFAVFPKLSSRASVTRNTFRSHQSLSEAHHTTRSPPHPFKRLDHPPQNNPHNSVKMFARIALRAPITARVATRSVRFNSSSSSSSAARVIQMAAEAERPSTFDLTHYARYEKHTNAYSQPPPKPPYPSCGPSVVPSHTPRGTAWTHATLATTSRSC